MDQSQDVAEMLRYDVAQLQRVVDGVTAELPLTRVAPEIGT